MNEINYDRVYKIFDRYGTFPNINVETKTQDFNYNLYGGSVGYPGRMAEETTVTMNLIFLGAEPFRKFARDLICLDELFEDELLRSQNPTLQKAYEEYQILLRLTK